MADPPLDPKELEAIQEAIRQARSAPLRAKAPNIEPEEVIPLALIADDRAAEIARPAGMRIAEQWAGLTQRRLRHLAHGDVEVAVVSTETVDGTVIRNELSHQWMCCLQPKERSGAVILAVGGNMIEFFAARLLGALDSVAEEERVPSPTAIGVFQPVGDSIADALGEAWFEEQACQIARISNAEKAEAAKRALFGTDVIVAVTLSVRGAAKGRLRLFSRPTTLLPPPPAIEAVPATSGAIEEALGSVCVQIKVEFGRARLTMRNFAGLKVGAVIPLDQFVDDPLAVDCAGVKKAHGRAVVYRGVIAIEVIGEDALEQKEAA